MKMVFFFGMISAQATEWLAMAGSDACRKGLTVSEGLDVFCRMGDRPMVLNVEIFPSPQILKGKPLIESRWFVFFDVCKIARWDRSGSDAPFWCASGVQ